jgi:hypothetical protein
LTDIEGSTSLLKQQGSRYASLYSQHERIRLSVDPIDIDLADDP